MLLAGLMALHAAAFAAWLAAAAAEAALDLSSARTLARRVALRWAVPAMIACLGSGALVMWLSYPFYRQESWLWMKVILTMPAAFVTLLRAAGVLRPVVAFRLVTGLLAATLLLSFLRPF